MFIVVNAQIRLLPASVYVERLAATRNPFDCSISCAPGAIRSYISFSFPSLTRPSEARCAQFCTAATSRPVSVSCVPDASDRANYFDLTCVPRSNRHVYASGNTSSSKVTLTYLYEVLASTTHQRSTRLLALLPPCHTIAVPDAPFILLKV
jgi:hypothetical protein